MSLSQNEAPQEDHMKEVLEQATTNAERNSVRIGRVMAEQGKKFEDCVFDAQDLRDFVTDDPFNPLAGQAAAKLFKMGTKRNYMFLMGMSSPANNAIVVKALLQQPDLEEGDVFEVLCRQDWETIDPALCQQMWDKYESFKPRDKEGDIVPLKQSLEFLNESGRLTPAVKKQLGAMLSQQA